MPASNGGTALPLNLALYPMMVAGVSNALFKFDTTNFADQNNPSVYNWKDEDGICGRNPTIGRVLLSVRDLGTAQIILTLSGTNDSQAVVSSSVTYSIGTILVTGEIITYSVIGLTLTAQNLQLNITRPTTISPSGIPNGAVSITKVRMEGRIETTPYA
jgi:hypothetical protein